MSELKLRKIADRTPVKLTISVLPDLHQALTDYTILYRQAYGQEQSIVELIPAMLNAFLEGDRSFSKDRAKLRKEN